MKIPPNAPKPKVGQIWRKKDTGFTVQLTGRKKQDYFATKRINGKKSHSIYGKDLQMFWECISCN